MEWSLCERLRQQLRHVVRSTSDARLCRQCEGLLQVDDGHPIAGVSLVISASRGRRLDRWRERAGGGLIDHAGRDRQSGGTAECIECIKNALEQSPREFDFQSTGWTVGMLKAHLGQQLGWTVSELSIRRRLHKSGYVWKRCRYVLKPDPQRERKRGIRRKAGDLTSGTAVLFQDETAVTLFPRVRSGWTNRGAPAAVEIHGGTR